MDKELDRRNFLECVGGALAATMFTGASLPKANSPEPETTPDGRVIFRATILTCDKANKNGRIYPRSLIEKEVERLNEGAELLGTLGFGKGSTVSFQDVSHIAQAFRLEGDDMTCQIAIINTPPGETLKQLLRGGNVAFRTGGVGNVSVRSRVNCENGLLESSTDQIVQDGFKFYTVAAVPADKAA
jgi:hypothetical protein